MAKKLKINFKQTQTIREAFDDFLLQKKALGLADKTIETYSHEPCIQEKMIYLLMNDDKDGRVIFS